MEAKLPVKSSQSRRVVSTNAIRNIRTNTKSEQYMELLILDPNDNKSTLSATVEVNKTQAEIFFSVTFNEQFLKEKYGVLQIANKDGYWKFPIAKTDRYLIALVSNLIFQIIQIENV